ncbi:hypothetical protein F5884DRAFT_757004 [Xylogone sp. PMI_703]|nr:hypothetical protein F5884DRAFT_757004 [Xylogone sp. PMI_703]
MSIFIRSLITTTAIILGLALPVCNARSLQARQTEDGMYIENYSDTGCAHGSSNTWYPAGDCVETGAGAGSVGLTPTGPEAMCVNVNFEDGSWRTYSTPLCLIPPSTIAEICAVVCD